MKKLLLLLLCLGLCLCAAACEKKGRPGMTGGASHGAEADTTESEELDLKDVEAFALGYMEKRYGSGISAHEEYTIFTYAEQLEYTAYCEDMSVQEYAAEQGHESAEEYLDSINDFYESYPETFAEDNGVAFEPVYSVDRTEVLTDDRLAGFRATLDDGAEAGIWDVTSEDLEGGVVVYIKAELEKDGELMEADETVVVVIVNGELKTVND